MSREGAYQFIRWVDRRSERRGVTDEGYPMWWLWKMPADTDDNAVINEAKRLGARVTDLRHSPQGDLPQVVFRWTPTIFPSREDPWSGDVALEIQYFPASRYPGDTPEVSAHYASVPASFRWADALELFAPGELSTRQSAPTTNRLEKQWYEVYEYLDYLRDSFKTLPSGQGELFALPSIESLYPDASTFPLRGILADFGEMGYITISPMREGRRLLYFDIIAHPSALIMSASDRPRSRRVANLSTGRGISALIRWVDRRSISRRPWWDGQYWSFQLPRLELQPFLAAVRRAGFELRTQESREGYDIIYSALRETPIERPHPFGTLGDAFSATLREGYPDVDITFHHTDVPDSWRAEGAKAHLKSEAYNLNQKYRDRSTPGSTGSPVRFAQAFDEKGVLTIGPYPWENAWDIRRDLWITLNRYSPFSQINADRKSVRGEFGAYGAITITPLRGVERLVPLPELYVFDIILDEGARAMSLDVPQSPLVEWREPAAPPAVKPMPSRTPWGAIALAGASLTVLSTIGVALIGAIALTLRKRPKRRRRRKR